MSFIKNDPKIMKSWVAYDWANSVYNLVITTAIFPIFYGNKTKTLLADGTTTDIVHFFGRAFHNTELYTYVFSAAYLVVAFLSPLLSGIADYTGSKKMFLKFFCYMGAISCACFYFFDMSHFELSMLPVFTASIGFWSSLVFYNSYLLDIADRHHHDSLSAKGFSLGYIGSTILLVFSLVAIKLLNWDVRYIFVLVGIWWAGFAQITYFGLPKIAKNNSIVKKNYLLNGFRELRKVFIDIQSQYNLKRFISAYFVYNAGVQTVLIVAVPFADKEIFKLEADKPKLIIAVIIIQLLAAIGAWVMNVISKRLGNIMVLKIVVSIWIIGCVISYYITSHIEFYFLAALVGFVMGGIQSMSRSTYAKLIPDTKDTTSYFSFYDVSEKIGLVLGTFLFAFIEGLFGNMRTSILVLIVFFVIGFLLLLRMKNEKILQNAS